MKITDPKALKILKRANSEILDEYVDTFPDDELDEMTELQMVLDELNYLILMYEDEGTLLYENLELSKKILKETHQGKSVIIEVPSFKLRYQASEIQDAKYTVNEYRRLKRLQKEFCT